MNYGKFTETHKEEPFIRLIRDKKGLYKFPDPKFVVGSNFCDVGFDMDENTSRIVALSASDNLMKGAAGSAIQNMNLMCGYNETNGLRYTVNTGMIVIKFGGSVLYDLHPSIIEDIRQISLNEKMVLVMGW